jgi:hypothetical protein
MDACRSETCAAELLIILTGAEHVWPAPVRVLRRAEPVYTAPVIVAEILAHRKHEIGSVIRRLTTPCGSGWRRREGRRGVGRLRPAVVPCT